MDTMTSKDSIQQQISETFLKLEAAKEEELKAQEALEEFLANARKEKIPAVWIK